MKIQLTKQFFARTLLAITISFFVSMQTQAQTWAALTNQAPDYNGGVMLLLSDGTVMAKTSSGGGDNIGNIWNRLTPDSLGSYINGTWTALTPMNNTRLYFASQVLKDGRVFVAGGEYGTGGLLAETYDLVTNSWTMAPNQGQLFYDANSKILPDGKVLVAILGNTYSGDSTIIFDPKTNSWINGAVAFGSHDEASWLKLPDNSILFINLASTASERYIPSLNQWVVDATVPVQIYDAFDFEAGAGILLPDGRAFFMGATGHTAYYTPSGNINPGTWAAGPDIPNLYGTTDAAAAMMVNGKILCAASPAPTAATYDPPTAFFEFDYLTNTFTPINAPDGNPNLNEACYVTNMLDLPDGTVLFSNQGDLQYYIYSPGGTPLASGKPTIATIVQTACDTFRATGTLFNGISDGAAYGDDWQMATNYPVIRLMKGTKVYYVKTFEWNSTGTQRGALPDTTFFTVPATVPSGTYSLVVTANGIASNPVSFVYSPCTTGMVETENVSNTFFVYPNPASEMLTVEYRNKNAELKIVDVLGNIVKQAKTLMEKTVFDISDLQNGVYFISVKDATQKTTTAQKIIVHH